MKVVILAGGLGTRLAEETEVRPKPMVEIGGRPILWHIMKHYAHHGHTEFVIALGYKGDHIKRYFLDYGALAGGLTVELRSGAVTLHDREIEDWRVHLVDTGIDTNTGGRVRRLRRLLGDEPFMLTYGDGVSDVDLGALLAFHRAQGKTATLTAVRPPARFGGLELDGPAVTRFSEKTQIGEGWVNGGYMVLEPQVFEHLSSDRDSLELVAFEELTITAQMAAYRHERYWQCMDTLREKHILQKLWETGHAPWKCWD